MKNSELINDFINGAISGKASNLEIDGNSLINYSTVIAYRSDKQIILNSQSYSRTTNVHQNRIRREAINVIEVETERNFLQLIKNIRECKRCGYNVGNLQTVAF